MIAEAKLDKKFTGQVFKVKDGSVVPHDQWLVFLAKDNAFPATVAFYRQECERLGADAEHLASVDRMIERLTKWRADNPHRLKVPDAKGEKLSG